VEQDLWPVTVGVFLESFIAVFRWLSSVLSVAFAFFFFLTPELFLQCGSPS